MAITAATAATTLSDIAAAPAAASIGFSVAPAWTVELDLRPETEKR
jgi:hypothetical protein